jgi:hypothetical protein
MTPRVAVVGAGLAGLAAADALRRAGLAPVVFEKSRGIGGRLATRRTAEGLDFDHGAPSAAADGGPFAAFLDAAVRDGDAARWAGETVGLPGMSGLARGLAAGLDLRFGAEVAAVTREEGGWRVAFADRPAARFDRVVVAAPAPQAARLCAGAPEIAGPAAAAEMTPCWAVMAAWDAPAPTGPARADGAGPLAAATCVSAKPGRAATPARWVGHATVDWTRAHLEAAPGEALPPLLAALAGLAGVDPATARVALAHRWRFARVAQAVGAPCLAAPGGLVAAGDWLLGPDAADAYVSGLAAGAAALG